ncbi:TRAPP II complex [Lipomyces chichibuensis]|uniref:TRAPP II complex n=1 Tax=Lipomyces chichibuensis TaxID=1546026 RepID=UPI003343A5D4
MPPQPQSVVSTPLDSLSYAAPSRIRAFLCPVGLVSRPRFLDFVSRLQDTAIIRLGDVTPDPRPERVMFSPQGFPDGFVVYNFVTSIDSHHAFLEDLELYRRTLAVFGLADYNNVNDLTDLRIVIGALQAQHPQALIHKVILFDCPLEQNELPSVDFICVPPKRASRITTVRTTLCDLTSALLAELPLLAKAFQAADTIASPLARDDDYDSVMLTSSAVAQSRPSPAGSTGSLPSTINKDNRLSYPLSHHTERQRMRRKGRSMKMIANMYLLAGRTFDALKEYNDALNVLKGVGDHLWHASSLEGIGICMVILAHIGVSFVIPNSVLPPVSPSSEKKELEQPQLLDLLPQMTSNILSLYNRSQNFPGESVPQITYAETILRTTNLLACTTLAGGWTSAARTAAVLSRPIPEISIPYSQFHHAKMDVMNWISAAQAVRLDGVDAVDAARILTGVAAACGKLGYSRKRGFVLRQLVLELIPRIFQARQVAQNRKSRLPWSDVDDDEYWEDSRDVYVQPQDLDSSVLAVLSDICTVYGIPVDSTGEVSTFGWQGVKTSILKTCIGLCQVMPDFVGIVRYTSMLFRFSAEDLTVDEQLTLMRNFGNAYTAARSMGVQDFEQEYWDAYLVRDIAVVESSLWAVPTLVPLDAAPSNRIDSSGPFIYSPFAKKGDEEDKKHLFVLDEPVEFKVILQNPFAFELDILTMSLVGTGTSFSSDVISLVVPPRKLYPASIYLTPTSTGVLNITGCRFQVLGCKETIFSITPAQAAVTPPVRIKNFGLDARNSSMVKIPSPAFVKHVSVEVVPALPVLRVNRISLPQSSLMLLEGERRRFVIALGNVSETVPATSVSLKFSDSTTKSLSAALQEDSRGESDRYEIEMFLHKRAALRCVTDLNGVKVPANGEAEIELEVLGKRGLTSACIEISYSHVFDSNVVLKEMYVRTLTLDINVTVNASIEVAGCDFVPFSYDMPMIRTGDGKATTTDILLKFLDQVGIPFEEMDNYCLMLLDLRNSWPSQLAVELDSRTTANDIHTVKKVIQPGHLTRLLVPIRRISDIDTSLPIPSLAPPKQFTRSDVKSMSGDGSRKSGLWSPEVERTVFWYREELLKVLDGRWTDNISETDGLRRGAVELRALRISPQMVEIIRVDDVVVNLSLAPSEYNRRSGKYHWIVEADSFLTLVTSVTSHSTADSVSGILRIQPTLRNLPDSIALDINRRILFNGILQMPVVDIKSGDTRRVETDFVVLVRGEYEFLASFEETTAGFGGKRYIGREKFVISVN